MVCLPLFIVHGVEKREIPRRYPWQLEARVGAVLAGGGASFLEGSVSTWPSAKRAFAQPKCRKLIFPSGRYLDQYGRRAAQFFSWDWNGLKANHSCHMLVFVQVGYFPKYYPDGGAKNLS
jgi:hypothetical protein